MSGVTGLLLFLAAQTGTRAVEVEFTPTGDPQIAVWLENARGEYVDTVMVTRLTGTLGLGNRPGRADFGGGFNFPYGKREMVLPVWAHRRGVEYDRLVFQDCKESWLGWHEVNSSPEPFYCRPLTQTEMSAPIDTISCPTTQFNTDKGIPLRLVRSSDGPDCPNILGLPPKTYYPPRNDIAQKDPSRDWDGVMGLRDMNELDAISRATPPADQPYKVTYRVPAGMPYGEYVLWVEVNQEYDTNAFHDYDYFIDPALRDYGVAHVGQPSVLWRVPFTVSATATVVRVGDYAGYGAFDGADGQVRPRDNTITTGIAGSGEGRLKPVTDASGAYRVRVRFSPDATCTDPAPLSGLTLLNADWEWVELSFTAPPGDGQTYEIYYAEGAGSLKTNADLGNGTVSAASGPMIGGQTQSVRLKLPRPETTYAVGVRTINGCGAPSELSTLTVKTAIREFATVDACFIATAAHGSKDAPDVVTLRHFRDRVLKKTALGRGFVELYYALSPPIADRIRDSEGARAAVRGLLRPLVWLIRTFE